VVHRYTLSIWTLTRWLSSTYKRWWLQFNLHKKHFIFWKKLFKNIC